ncbi:MAG: hypothetical protein HC896_17870 [Bacteroidales bacterium]|nr:hypothetical protein [Bacteroidales bacterium]
MPYIIGADLLYHEATFLHKELKRARETCHSTARQAGMLAQKAGAGQLLIGHFSARYANTDELLAEAKEEFANVVAVEDNMTFEAALRRATI